MSYYYPKQEGIVGRVEVVESYIQVATAILPVVAVMGKILLGVSKEEKCSGCSGISSNGYAPGRRRELGLL